MVVPKPGPARRRGSLPTDREPGHGLAMIGAVCGAVSMALVLAYLGPLYLVFVALAPALLGAGLGLAGALKGSRLLGVVAICISALSPVLGATLRLVVMSLQGP